VRDVYAELSRDKATAAQTAFTVVKNNPVAAKELMDEAGG
jgi:hypothetical protein